MITILFVVADFTLRFISISQNSFLNGNQELLKSIEDLENRLKNANENRNGLYKAPKILMPTKKIDEKSQEFCINGRLVPSLFVIGVQKCGTTTLDAILKKFSGLSHGARKEHHFFDQSKNQTLQFDKYINQFPVCNGKIKISYDASPHYTNYNQHVKAAENIKKFYNSFDIPLHRLRFIAIVCPNSRRIPSNFYFSRSHGYLISPGRTFNKWFNWILKHQEHNNKDLDNPLRKGFYDEIFRDYLEAFPESNFLFIDNEFAFKEMQKMSDFLAIELNTPKQQVPDIHKMKGKPKEEMLTAANLKRLNIFYSKHERNFLEIIKTKANVKIWPEDKFLVNWK